ncbi:MAG TPA: hypothetical protein VG796_20120 [Verrucomicrobiales bacterium]|nr:hypothetical protein [Verrucomicrobiales bacterium]
MIRPVFLTLFAAALSLAPAAGAPLTALWSIGEPTDEEQYYLELINRSRANPGAEGLRIANTTDSSIRSQLNGHNVNLEMFKAEMNAIPASGPLAINAQLTAVARAQSEYQFAQGKELHVDALGRGVFERVAASGYVPLAPYFPVENAFVSSLSTPFGHAAFEVDWGADPVTQMSLGGMQDPRKHRVNIHAGWREVGVGIYNGSKTVGGSIVGPQVITQIYGLPAGAPTPYVTGVASFDLNGNGFYDPGEGIGGVTVNVSGSVWHAVTSSSGGYAVPVVEAAGPLTVAFSGLGFNAIKPVAVTGTRSVKVDLNAVYAPPVVTGPAAPAVGINNLYSVSTVNGATGYDCRVLRKGAAAAAAADNANDLTRVTTNTSPGYSPLSTTVKQQGTGAWHLAQPANRTETITFKNTFLGGTTPSVRYQSRLRAASLSQSALVQVSTDGGEVWTTVETQTGSGGNGQSNFSQRTVALTGLAGREFMLRFAFTVSGLPILVNNSTGDEAGWYIDAVSFTNIDDIGVLMPLAPGTTLFPFVPASTGAWLLSARPVISGRKFAFGPAAEVNAGTVAPVLTFPLWCAGIELARSLPPGTIFNNPAGDYNGDGVPNLMAYALELDPVVFSGHLLPRAVVEEGILSLVYSRDTAKTDISLSTQISTDLQTWRAAGESGAPAAFTDVTLSTNGTLQQRRASVPATPGRPVYLRLKVTKL